MHYCLKCKAKTEDRDISSPIPTSNGRMRRECKCAHCGTKKSFFVGKSDSQHGSQYSQDEVVHHKKHKLTKEKLLHVLKHLNTHRHHLPRDMQEHLDSVIRGEKSGEGLISSIVGRDLLPPAIKNIPLIGTLASLIV